MELKIKPHEWADGEAYTVHIDGGGEHVSDAVGFLWRSAPGSYSFSLSDTFDPSDADAPSISCDTVAEAVKQLTGKIRAVEVPADRLSNAQMYGLVSQILVTLAALAKATNARPGYISALSTAVARAVVVDIRPEGEDAFMRAFVDEVERNIKSQRTLTSASDALVTAFAALFKDETDDEPNPKPH